MRLLFCIPTLLHGGAERRVALLATELRRRGHDVHVAVLRGGPNAGPLQLEPGRLHELPCAGNHDPRVALALWRLARRLRPDLVLTCITQMDVFGGSAAIAARVPFAIIEPSREEAYPPSWKNRLRERLGSRARLVVANSEGGAAFWRRRAPGLRCTVVRNGLPLGDIDGCPPAEPVLHGLTGDPLVLYVGRFDAAKNLDALVDGLALARRERAFQALLCGDGPQRPAVRARCETAGLAGASLPGEVATAWALMKRAAAFVSVSAFEGQPNAVLEAMACGAPLVVSDIPAHREFLDESCAVLVDGRDPAAIAAGVRVVLCDEDAARARAGRARQRVARSTVEAMADGYERACREALVRDTVR